MEFGFSATPVILVCAQLITAVGCAFVKGALPSRRHSRRRREAQRTKATTSGIYTSTGVSASISERVLAVMITDWIPAEPSCCPVFGGTTGFSENDGGDKNDGVLAQLCLLTNSWCWS